MQGDLRQQHGVRGVAGEDVVCVGGNRSGGKDVAVDRGEPWRVVKLVGMAGGTRRCPAESGPRSRSAVARGVPGAPVLLRSPRRTHRLGRMRERRWFMSLTSETNSEYERRGGRWALNRWTQPPGGRGTAEPIQCGLS